MVKSILLYEKHIMQVIYTNSQEQEQLLGEVIMQTFYPALFPYLLNNLKYQLNEKSKP